MEKLKLVLFVAFTVFSAQMVQAQKPHKTKLRTPETRFAKIDANKNGYISKMEFVNHMVNRKSADGDQLKVDKKFVKMDQNADGKISREEFIQHNRLKDASEN